MEPATYHWSYQIFSLILPLTDFAIRLGLSLRVIMRKRQYSVTFAWLIVILLVPFFGAVIYLLFGENRVGEKRARLTTDRLEHYHQWLQSLKKQSATNLVESNGLMRPIQTQADNLIRIPTLGGNTLEIIEEPEAIMRSIIKDIDAARSTCHLQFYIWHTGGTADDVTAAVIRAHKRGVTCRILVDSIGSKQFLRSNTVKELRDQGIKVVESLPAGFFKALFVRVDIRNHRKFVVIDGKTAYTGSQNLVDPRFFKQDEDVGEWVDIMLRIQGPVVEPIAGTFIGDWLIDADSDRIALRSLTNDIDEVRKFADIRPQPVKGTIPIQLVPSGPDFAPEAIHNLLLTTVYAARKKITLTTPYFVPDESLLTALVSSAQRGVEVSIIVPETIDSKLVHYASRARYEHLTEQGVNVKLFSGGLLHSKTITVDDEFSLLGSVNLDMRSFWLNFEATLFIYDKDFTKELYQVQLGYEKESKPVDMSTLANRSFFERFLENLSLLIGPLL